MKGLYKFYWDCNRMGYLDGIFVATEEQIKNLIGIRCYFGEVLGKYSEIFGHIEEADISLLTQEPKVIEVFEENNIEVGYNPLHYAQKQCTKCGIWSEEICDEEINGKIYSDLCWECVSKIEHAT